MVHPQRYKNLQSHSYPPFANRDQALLAQTPNCPKHCPNAQTRNWVNFKLQASWGGFVCFLSASEGEERPPFDDLQTIEKIWKQHAGMRAGNLLKEFWIIKVIGDLAWGCDSTSADQPLKANSGLTLWKGVIRGVVAENCNIKRLLGIDSTDSYVTRVWFDVPPRGAASLQLSPQGPRGRAEL